MGKSENTNRLIEAASSGDLITLAELLDKGVNPNRGFRDGHTPLMAAAMSGHVAIADDAPKQMSFTGNEYVQVLAHYCKKCRVMGVYQQCD